MPFKTIDELISLWPTGADFARDLGLKPNHAGVFKVRGNLPSEYWTATIRAAAARGIKGVTAETLLAMQERQKAAAS